MSKVILEVGSKSYAYQERRAYINYNKAYRPELKKKGAVILKKTMHHDMEYWQVVDTTK